MSNLPTRAEAQPKSKRQRRADMQLRCHQARRDRQVQQALRDINRAASRAYVQLAKELGEVTFGS